MAKIPDQIFKKLKHNCKGYTEFKYKKELEAGYKPDHVLQNKDHYIIMECEGTTSRKGYIGGMVKAAHFLQGKRKGILIYIVERKNNTSVESITKQLARYFKFIKGITNLSAVYVIETDDYHKNNKVLEIHSSKFNASSVKIDKKYKLAE